MTGSEPAGPAIWGANARMYAPAPSAAEAWRALFAAVADAAGVPLAWVDHPAPKPLGELWARDDLAACFMCGLPYALEMRERGPRPIVAAPVPLSEAAPVYRSKFVVRADAPFRTLEDTFGHRLGWTVPDSHSGYNAPRRHLLRLKGARERLYAQTVGPLVHPRAVVEAVRDGRVDVGPVDGFAFAIMARHLPHLIATVRVVAETDAAPIPPVVASHGAPPDVVDRLSAAFLAVADRADLAGLRDDLCLTGFARPRAEDYRLALDWAAEAEAAGYPEPA